jgi:outer membrane receptor protein involved in Fe transport
MPNYSTFTALSVFYREINDRITWMPTGEGLWKPQNINRFSTKGVEAEFNLDADGFISTRLGAIYLIARQINQELVYSYYDWTADTTHNEFEETERIAAFVPAFAFSLDLDLAMPKGFFLHIGNAYTSKRYNHYENWSNYPEISMDVKTLKSSYILDTHLSCEFFNKLELTAGIRNLLDTGYSTQFGNSIYDRDYPMPGRTYFAEIGWR